MKNRRLASRRARPSWPNSVEVGSLELDDWGHNWGSNKDGDFGALQFRVRGKLRAGVVRLSWQFNQGAFNVTRIEEITSDDSAKTLWPAGA